MAASESSEGPPDNATSPRGTSGTIVTNELQMTLDHLYDNMSSMTHMLELIYKERCPPGNDNMKRVTKTADSNSLPLPPKRARAESAGEYSADEDDSLSVTTSDNLENDVDELVNPTNIRPAYRRRPPIQRNLLKTSGVFLARVKQPAKIYSLSWLK